MEVDFDAGGFFKSELMKFLERNEKVQLFFFAENVYLQTKAAVVKRKAFKL
jgi:hypothetical protein